MAARSLKRKREEIDLTTVPNIQASREMTSAELNIFPKIRRRIKNRESARASRQSKRDGVEDSEKKIQDIAKENADLMSDIAHLRTMNLLLIKENVFMKQMIVSNPYLCRLFLETIQG